MPRILWDASALIKRYVVEVGTPTVNAILSEPTCEMIVTLWGYVEMFAILNLRLNSGALTRQLYSTQISSLQHDLLSGSTFTMLSISDASLLSALPLIQTHSLNCTDAAILAAFIALRQTMPGLEQTFILLSADQRLARAGVAEGFTVINPEIVEPINAISMLAAA